MDDGPSPKTEDPRHQTFKTQIEIAIDMDGTGDAGLG